MNFFSRSKPTVYTTYESYKKSDEATSVFMLMYFVYGNHLHKRDYIDDTSINKFLSEHTSMITTYYNLYKDVITTKIQLLQQFVDKHQFDGDAEFDFKKKIAQTILNGLKKLHEKNISTQPIEGGRKFRKSRKGKRRNRKSKKYIR